MEHTPLSALEKGVPPRFHGASPAELIGWSVLEGPLPVCVIRETALDHNLEAMRAFADRAGALLCPHGKTTMTPRLFERQLAAGAWGITLATLQQVRVARAHGIQRILYANELTRPEDVAYVRDELERDPELDFYCLVDSVEGAELVAGLDRLKVLLEVGAPGVRGGVRDLATAHRVAEVVPLAGVEGFEGLLPGDDAVREYLRFVAEVAGELGAELVTAGGSAYFDVVAEELSGFRLVLRSGCYVVHDHGHYARLTEGRGVDLWPALEVWAHVLSVPEPELVILSAGRRDFGQDAGDPVPLRLDGCEIVAVSDQHAHMRAPAGHGLQIGDAVALGPSHPCTTFDKWRVIYVVDDEYRVTDVLRTYF
jgi:D-serine dehydratase